MWGPQPDKERKRLKPGDRLADGRTFMGSDPVAVLEAELERILLQLNPLEAQRDELLTRLHELAPEKYGPVIQAVEAETIPVSKPKALRQAQDKAKRGSPA